MDLYNDISPQIMQIVMIAIVIIFAIVLYVVFRDRAILRKDHEDIDQRVWACEHCPHPDKCERMFKGEDLDPKYFCPNYRELEKLK